MTRVLPVLLAALLAAPAYGETCPVMAGAPPELGEVPAIERLSYLRKALSKDARNMAWWSAVFAVGYAGTTGYSLGLALTAHDRGDRIDNYTGAAASFIGFALITFTPKKILLDHPRLEREVRMSEARGGGDVCRLVAEGERLLLRDAADEAFGTGILTQAGNFVFNMGIGAMLVGLGRYKEAAILTFSGIGVGEIMIVTQPIGAVKALGYYRNGALGKLDLLPSAPKLSWSVTPAWSKNSGGLDFGLRF